MALDHAQLNDPSLYHDLTTSELLLTLVNLHLLSSKPIVDFSMKFLTSRLMDLSAFRIPSLWAVKKLAFAHFCAGEDLTEASATLQRMWELGMQGILNYSLEDATDNVVCDRNAQVFVETIRQAQKLPPGSVSFACVKLTAICPLTLLERVSQLLRWQHMNAGFKLSWQEEGLPLFALESPTFHVQKEPQPLSAEEKVDLAAAKQRLWRLCEESREIGYPLLVDAECTRVQPAIDYLTYAAELHFNAGREQPLVYGTMQSYLKDSFPRLTLAMDAASKMGVPLGVKLVRGAYLVRESTLAGSLRVSSPIHSCIEETHNCYNASANFLLERAAAGQGSVILATHNKDSARAAAAKAMELRLRKVDGRVQFGQIKGMADGLSLGLVRAGFRVSKYLPFGPVALVMPYLIRRAQENRGVLSNAAADGLTMRKELTRRLFRFTT